eukprot:scaffold19825_cov103-Isochrysis_galbana.AAC.4
MSWHRGGWRGERDTVTRLAGSRQDPERQGQTVPKPAQPMPIRSAPGRSSTSSGSAAASALARLRLVLRHSCGGRSGNAAASARAHQRLPRQRPRIAS